jgi:hypothetical protein
MIGRRSERTAEGPMSKDQFGMETTIRVVRDENGRSHFARPFNLREWLLKATLPALWVLVAVVVAATLWW